MQYVKVFFISVLVLITCPTSAQTYIKSNALYWLGLLPNVQVETRLSNHFTFQGEVNVSLWASIADRPYIGMQAIVGVRYYPKCSFKGFYVGADASFDTYKVSKWGHSTADVQHGVGMYYGLTGISAFD